MALAKGLRSVKGIAASPYSEGPYVWDADVTVQQPGLSHKRYVLTEYFKKLPQLNATIDQVYTTEAARNCNTDFEILGTNASNDDVTFSATVGGLQLQTDGASGDQVIVLPHLDSSYTAWTGIKWGTENQTTWECLLRTDSSVASIVIWAGLKLTNTSVVATDADQAFFRFDAGIANWEAVSSVAGSDTETDTGVAVSANTVYHLKIAIDSDRKAHFYINGDEVAVSAALTNDIDLIPYVGVQSSATAAKTIHLAAEQISRIIFE